MARSIKAALRNLSKHVLDLESRINKLFSLESAAGTRAVPAKTDKNDRELGVRIDHGDVHVRNGVTYRRVKLQANKQAADPSIKKKALADSHKVYATADLQIDPPPQDRKKAAKKMFKDIEDNVKA